MIGIRAAKKLQTGDIIHSLNHNNADGTPRTMARKWQSEALEAFTTSL